MKYVNKTTFNVEWLHVEKPSQNNNIIIIRATKNMFKHPQEQHKTIVGN
jgi:hypothetical protein